MIDENDSRERILDVAQHAQKDGSQNSWTGMILVLVSILTFIAAHAIGQGAVIWVFISEIFPSSTRAFGQSLGSATHWIFAAILTFVFPLAMEAFTATQIFGFFAFMMIIQLIWVRLMVPETKGVSLEDMQDKLSKA